MMKTGMLKHDEATQFSSCDACGMSRTRVPELDLLELQVGMTRKRTSICLCRECAEKLYGRLGQILHADTGLDANCNN